MVSFVTQRNLDAAAIAALLKHGCFIDLYDVHSEITFPEGTVKEEVWPRVGGGAYNLVLPDGYECAVRYVRYLGQYLVFYSPER